MTRTSALDLAPHSRDMMPTKTLLPVALLAAFLVACSGPPRTARDVEVATRDIPHILRGTIGAEASIRGLQPTLISGFGLVVGLNGTGGGELPVEVQATMERMLARNGIGRGGNLVEGPMAGKSPAAVLRDPNVAVVIVEAIVPPGAPKGWQFDVNVRTLPSSSVTSLEGGTLWTTELFIGPPAVFGAVQTRQLGVARGDIFINPYQDPAGGDAWRTRGRVLGGGRTIGALKLELVLDSPSHQRARAVVAAINSRFPQGPHDAGPIASGRNESSIALAIPHEYRQEPVEFIELLLHTRVDQAFAPEFARRYVEELARQPALAEDLAWCLRAIGKPAVPFLEPMYDYPELAPRLAALTAGAALDDARCVPHLLKLANAAPGPIRAQAISLLGEVTGTPQIDFALRDLVDDEDLEVRIAAYEALRRRADPWVERRAIGSRVSPKFILDQVPSSDPLIYVTLQDEPRIVLFGDIDLDLEPEEVVAAWDNRLLMVSREEGPQLRYEDYRTGRVVTTTAARDLENFIAYISRRQTPESPEPGLDFTYSQVVGTLYELQRQQAVNAGFAEERDRFMAALLDATDNVVLADRPEAPGATGSEEPWHLRKPDAEAPAAPADEPMIVPIEPTGAGSSASK